MNRLMPVFLFALSLSPAVAREELEKARLYKEPSPETLTPGTLKGNEEVFLYSESLLMEDKGGYSEAFYTGTDRNRFSLGAHMSSNYQDPNELVSLEILFSRRLEGFTQAWISFMAKNTRATYDAIAEEIQTNNANVNRIESTQTLTTLGAGGGYRFKALSRAWNTDRIFETMDVFLTYTSHLDSSEDAKYQGWGLQTDYGLHYRAGESFFYGGKFSYNIVTAQRAAEEDEKLKDRSLVFGWLSLGLELGYYY